MKTITRLGLVLLIAVLPASLQAKPERPTAKHERCWKGTITAVDTQNQTLTAEDWPFTKTFDLGRRCAIVSLDNQHAALGDLRPGEKVSIRYQEAEGVRVANRIAENALHYAGTVHSVNRKTDIITMAEAPLYQPFKAPRTFRAAQDCKVTLWNGREGTLANVKPGDRVWVVYEVPRGSQVAYRIRVRTASSQGVAEAIDLSAHTLKVKEGSKEKNFALGDDCQVMLSRDKVGHLKDLMSGQKYRFTYQDVNGIKVIEWIAPVPAAKTAETASLR
jgi:hypothetical protein